MTDELAVRITSQLSNELSGLTESIKKEIHDKYIGRYTEGRRVKYQLTGDGLKELKEEFKKDLLNEFLLDAKNEVTLAKEVTLARLKLIEEAAEIEIRHSLDQKKSSIDVDIQRLIKDRVNHILSPRP